MGMTAEKKRTNVRVIEAKVGRKKLAILLVKPAERMPFSDQVIDKLLVRYKAGVFIGYRLLPARKTKKHRTRVRPT
jgi:hypothetical protein